MVDVHVLVRVDELMPVAEWPRVITQGAVERSAVGCDEADRAVVECYDYDVAFMHLSVVEPAQTDEI